MYIYCEIKTLIHCTLVFAHTKCRFSHDAVPMFPGLKTYCKSNRKAMNRN